MRISDWRSDVCSSDLHRHESFGFENANSLANRRSRYFEFGDEMRFGRQRVAVDQFAANDGVAYLPRDEFRSLGNPDGLRIAKIADGNCDKSVRPVTFIFSFSTRERVVSGTSVSFRFNPGSTRLIN